MDKPGHRPLKPTVATSRLTESRREPQTTRELLAVAHLTRTLTLVLKQALSSGRIGTEVTSMAMFLTFLGTERKILWPMQLPSVQRLSLGTSSRGLSGIAISLRLVLPLPSMMTESKECLSLRFTLTQRRAYTPLTSTSKAFLRRYQSMITCHTFSIAMVTKDLFTKERHLMEEYGDLF